MIEYSIDEILMKSFRLDKTYVYDDVKQTEQNPEGKRCELYMQYVGKVEKVCKRCGAKTHSHGARYPLITDTTFTGLPTKLKLEVPRRRCPNCGRMWSPELPSVDENHKMTKRVYAKLASLSLKRSFIDIANEYGLSKNTVKNVFVEYIREKDDLLRFETPAFLGLDEIKIKKLGELTVITDLEHKTLYDMMQGRNQASLTEYFSQMPNRERVLWVCTDMYRPFEKSIKTAFPNARWVIDHYHVVAYANRAMDAIRISVQSKLSEKERIATKKGLAYTLRTRERNLTPEDAMKIRSCRNSEVLAPLATAFDLKEDFFNIYDENPTSVDNAKQAFAEWVASIPEEKEYNDFRKLAKTVHNFYDQIFNFWICPVMITNGFTECTNRIIRENNVRGRGNSFEILRGRTLYRYTNLERIENNSMMLGPSIPKRGPVFHYEEVNGIEEETAEVEDDYFNSFDYDPTIGLIPGVNFDPETGEIFDETLLDGWMDDQD